MLITKVWSFRSNIDAKTTMQLILLRDITQKVKILLRKGVFSGFILHKCPSRQIRFRIENFWVFSCFLKGKKLVLCVVETDRKPDLAFIKYRFVEGYQYINFCLKKKTSSLPEDKQLCNKTFSPPDIFVAHFIGHISVDPSSSASVSNWLVSVR